MVDGSNLTSCKTSRTKPFIAVRASPFRRPMLMNETRLFDFDSPHKLPTPRPWCCLPRLGRSRNLVPFPQAWAALIQQTCSSVFPGWSWDSSGLMAFLIASFVHRQLSSRWLFDLQRWCYRLKGSRKRMRSPSKFDCRQSELQSGSQYESPASRISAKPTAVIQDWQNAGTDLFVFFI